MVKKFAILGWNIRLNCVIHLWVSFFKMKFTYIVSCFQSNIQHLSYFRSIYEWEENVCGVMIRNFLAVLFYEKLPLFLNLTTNNAELYWHTVGWKKYIWYCSFLFHFYCYVHFSLHKLQPYISFEKKTVLYLNFVWSPMRMSTTCCI